MSGCASTRVDSGLQLRDSPCSNEQQYVQSARGESKRPRIEWEKDAKELAGKFSSEIPQDSHWTQDLYLFSDGEGYKLSLHRESGWLPQKYVRMLNEAEAKDYIMGYALYVDGAVNDKNGNGARDSGEAVLKRPVVVIRKANGAYCIAAYEERDDGDIKDDPRMFNIRDCNDVNAVAKKVSVAKNVARTKWPELKPGVRQNPLVRVRTNGGVKEFYVPGADGDVIWLDHQLREYMKRVDAEPKNSREIGE